MQDAYQNPVIETSKWNSGKFIHSEYTHHDFSSNPSTAVYPYNTQTIYLQAPSTTFAPAAVSGNTIARDSRYALESSYTWSFGNVQQATPHDGVTDTYIWDYKNSEPVAKAVNATVGQTAYTSFESNGTGNWIVPGAPDASHGGFTGNLAYNLNSGPVSCSGLASGTAYVVSYWTTATIPNTIAGTTSTLQGKTININGTNWTYFEHKVTGVTSVSVPGTSYIDELRLYPSTAQMTTYTYNLLEGMSTECDVDNRVTYYYYDALGRMRYIKDQDGNIIKTIEYHYMNQ
jgi:YD repeat-containing protein